MAQCIYIVIFSNAKSTYLSNYPIMYRLTYLLIYLISLTIYFYADINLLNSLLTYLFILYYLLTIDAIGVGILSFCPDAISVRFLSSKIQHKANVMKKNNAICVFLVSVLMRLA